MGTRADFYIKKAEEKELTWIASIAWDGSPSGIDEQVLNSKTESDFISNLQKFLSERDDVTLPQNGWPWPWSDSRTTDYSYIFNDGKVMASCFGHTLFDPLDEQSDEDCDSRKMDNYFPNMENIKNVRYDKGSGLIILSAKL